MKKELLMASALTASFGLAKVADAASASFSGSVFAGVTGDDLESSSDETYGAVQEGALSFSVSETTDGGVKISSGFTVVNEGAASATESGLTLTFTDGSTLDVIAAGNAYGGALASVPAASGEQGISDTSANNAPTDLDWADTSDAVGIDWGSAADFMGVEGLTFGVSAAFGDDGDGVGTTTSETSYSMGATYETSAGETKVTIGGGFIQADTSNATASNDMADSAAVSIAATTGNLTVGAGFSNGSGLAASAAAGVAMEVDSANYVEAGAKYTSGDIVFTVSISDGDAKDNVLGANSDTTEDSMESTSASIDYTVASGVTATLGYTDVTNSDDGTDAPSNSGSSWYVGASLSF